MGAWVDIRTQNNLSYVFIRETSQAVKLKVKAAQNAFIALTDEPYVKNPMTEIHIGVTDVSGSTKCVIKRDGAESNVAEVTIDDTMLNQNGFLDLWISWHDNVIRAGKWGESEFIKYKDLNLHCINHVGVRTGPNAIGHWKIEASPEIFRKKSIKMIEGGQLRWVKKSQQQKVPPDAFIGGYENGEVLYIARGMYRASLIPGKYVPSMECAIVSYGNGTTTINTCEILCGHNASWVRTREDQIPPHVFPAGYATETNREPLFIGRARVINHLIPGKVHAHYKTCFIPYEDKEMEFEEYEVLVVPNLPDSVVWRKRI